MWLWHKGRFISLSAIGGYERHIHKGEGALVSVEDRQYSFVYALVGNLYLIPGLFIYRRIGKEAEFAYFLEVIYPEHVTGMLIVDFPNLASFLKRFIRRVRKEARRLSWRRKEMQGKDHPRASVL